MIRNPNPPAEPSSSQGSSLAAANGYPVGIDRVGSDRAASEEWIGAQRFEITDIAGGCLVSTFSAVLSCFLLLINGAIVMALLSVAASGGAEWIQNEKLSQFLLFCLPITLLIVQWWLIDTLRWILRRRPR